MTLRNWFSWAAIIFCTLGRAQDIPAAASRPESLVQLQAALAGLDQATKEDRTQELLGVLKALEALTGTVADSRPAPGAESRPVDRDLAKAAVEFVAKRVEAIEKHLSDEHPSARRWAAAILGRLGDESRSAIPDLLGLTTDGDERVRDAASWAVATIVPKDEGLVPSLVIALASPDPNVRQNISWALCQMGPRAKGAAQALVPLLRDERLQTRINAARAIGASGVEGSVALEALVALGRDEQPRARAGAIDAIADMVIAIRAERDAPMEIGREYSVSERFATEERLTALISSASKTALDLLVRALDDADPVVRQRAGWALGALEKDGKPALGALVRAFDAADDATRPAIVWAIARIQPDSESATVPLATALGDADPVVRQNAAYALGFLGPRAEAATPALIRALADELSITRINAAYTLGAIGPAARAAVPALLEALSRTDASLVSQAAAAIRKIDPDSDAAIPKLIAWLDADDASLRSAGADALKEYGPRALAAVPALVGALDRDESWAAAGALVAIDRKGDSAVPALGRLLERADGRLRELIIEWVRAYGAAAREVAPRLIPLLGVVENKYELVKTLIAIQADPAALIPAIERVYVDARDEVPRSLLQEFPTIDPTGRLSIPALIRLLEHPMQDVREEAAKVVSRVGPAAAGEVVPALLRAFEQWVPKDARSQEPGSRVEHEGDTAEWFHRTHFLEALQALGPAARSAVPALLSHMKNEGGWIRCSLAGALAQIDPENPVVIDAIGALLRDRDESVRGAAADALEKIGPPAARVLPNILAALKEPDRNSRARVAGALRAIGPAAAVARDALIEQLADPDQGVVSEATDALTAIEPGPALTDVQRLAETLRDAPKSPMGVYTAGRLLRLGRDAKPALPALLVALHTDWPNVQRIAASVIARIGPGASDAVPELVRVLEQSTPEEKRPDGSFDTPIGSAHEWRVQVCREAISALGCIGPAAAEAIPLIDRVGRRVHVGMEADPLPTFVLWAIERIKPPERAALAVVIDQGLPDGPSSRQAGHVQVVPEPDGGFRVIVSSGGGFGGSWVEVFLNRTADGSPAGRADVWHYTDCGPPFQWRVPVVSGTLTLKAADWGSGKPITALVQLKTEKGPAGTRFTIEDPFVERQPPK